MIDNLILYKDNISAISLIYDCEYLNKIDQKINIDSIYKRTSRGIRYEVFYTFLVGKIQNF